MASNQIRKTISVPNSRGPSKIYSLAVSVTFWNERTTYRPRNRMAKPVGEVGHKFTEPFTFSRSRFNQSYRGQGHSLILLIGIVVTLVIDLIV